MKKQRLTKHKTIKEMRETRNEVIRKEEAVELTKKQIETRTFMMGRLSFTLFQS